MNKTFLILRREIKYDTLPGMSPKIEICEDMSCVIFNEIGYAITQSIDSKTKKIIKPNSLYLEECTWKPTNEIFYDFSFYEKEWLKDCDKF